MPGFELIGAEERQAVIDVFDKGGGVLFKHGFDALRNGSFKVREFQDAFGRHFGAKHCQAVTSGSTALKVALEALGVVKGDEVITQAFTFVATVEAITEVGAVPIITEVDETLNMVPADFERKITPRTKAVIPVHMYGSAAPLDDIMAIAKRRGILVLEDAAQALGGEYKGRKLGSIGDAGTFSFDYGKTLTTGEGGMIATSSKAVFDAAREFADHGHEENPALPRGEDTRKRRGFNYRMMELQAALGLAQLKKVDGAIKTQKENKRRIKDAVRGVKNITFRQFADEAGETGEVLVFFVENIPAKDKFVAALKAKGIGTKNLPDAINWHFAGTWEHIFKEVPYYQGKDVSKMFPASEAILRRAISIPIMIKMDDARIAHIVASIKDIAAGV